MRTESDLGGCACGVDWSAARRAATELLKSAYRVDIRKALNPLDPDDFLLMVEDLADQLHAISGPVEKRAVRAALAALDVDYANLTSAELAQVVHAANLSMRGIPAQILPQVGGRMRIDMTDTVRQTKIRVAKTYAWNIGTSFDAVDQQMVGAMSRIGGWVTDEYGTRASLFASGAETIITDGLAKGLRNDDIARDLQRHGQKTAVNKSKNYWRLVATNATNRARGFGNLRSMDSAGVTQYIFSAVMDERTSGVCQSLDGTTFPVSTGLASYSNLEVAAQSDPEAAEALWPFVKERSIGSGITEMYVQPRGGGLTVIGQRTPTGVQGVLGPNQLAAAGVSVPPIHHNCRSTIIPDI